MPERARPILLLIIVYAATGCGTPRPSQDEWVSLFNGKDLDGWVVKALPEDQGKTFWTVEEGAIVCYSIGRNDHDYVWLITEKEYGDFELGYFSTKGRILPRCLAVSL